MQVLLKGFDAYVNPHLVATIYVKPNEETDKFDTVVELVHTDSVHFSTFDTIEEARAAMIAAAELLNFVDAAVNGVAASPNINPPEERVEIGSNKTEFIRYITGLGFRMSQLMRDTETGKFGVALSHNDPVTALGETNTVTFQNDTPLEAIDALINFFHNAEELVNTRTGDDYSDLPGFVKALKAARKPPVLD